MTRRRTFSPSGSILDKPPGMATESWHCTNLCDPIKAAPLPPACQCRPNNGPTDLGGCHPGLRWVSHDRMEACCHLCMKPLVAGASKRRDQVRMLGLASMNLEHLDIPDLIAAGWLRGDRPEAEACQ